MKKLTVSLLIFALFIKTTPAIRKKEAFELAKREALEYGRLNGFNITAGVFCGLIAVKALRVTLSTLSSKARFEVNRSDIQIPNGLLTITSSVIVGICLKPVLMPLIEKIKAKRNRTNLNNKD